MAKFRSKRVDVVIDVRSHLEFWLGHLPGARCMPVGSIDRAIAKHDDIKSDSHIMVYCASGARSSAAADILRRMGFRRVVDAGGYANARQHFDSQ